MTIKHTGIGKRLQQRLLEMQKNPAWLTEQTRSLGQEVSAAAISIMIKRDAKRTQFLTILAQALGVSDQWLASGTGQKQRDAASEPAHEFTASAPAVNLATLFDHLPPERQREAWPWLVRMLATSPAMLATYLPFPADNKRVEQTYGQPGRKKIKTRA